MVSRLDKHEYETDASSSRVARNQELYKQLYNDDSYLKENQPSLERTTEIDIEKVRELLRGRETYRKEMKMREYNILKQEVPVESHETEIEEKNYDINEYLHKAAYEKEFQPYHKIDVEPVTEEEEEIDEEDETALEQMGNTELSLNMFGDLTSDDEELDSDDEIEEITKEITIQLEKEVDSDDEDDEIDDEDDEIDDEDDENFFTGSIKIRISDTEEDDEEDDSGHSLSIKIIMIILVVIIIALVAFLLLL